MSCAESISQTAGEEAALTKVSEDELEANFQIMRETPFRNLGLREK
jgi:hypothetical protein